MNTLILKEKDAPYITKKITILERAYNPKYGDDRMCVCGHPYHRHFDPYENMEPVGCKYCGCFEFEEEDNETSSD